MTRLSIGSKGSAVLAWAAALALAVPSPAAAGQAATGIVTKGAAGTTAVTAAKPKLRLHRHYKTLHDKFGGERFYAAMGFNGEGPGAKYVPAEKVKKHFQALMNTPPFNNPASVKIIPLGGRAYLSIQTSEGRTAVFDPRTGELSTKGPLLASKPRAGAPAEVFNQVFKPKDGKLVEDPSRRTQAREVSGVLGKGAASTQERLLFNSLKERGTTVDFDNAKPRPAGAFGYVVGETQTLPGRQGGRTPAYFRAPSNFQTANVYGKPLDFRKIAGLPSGKYYWHGEELKLVVGKGASVTVGYVPSTGRGGKESLLFFHGNAAAVDKNGRHEKSADLWMMFSVEKSAGETTLKQLGRYDDLMHGFDENAIYSLKNGARRLDLSKVLMRNQMVHSRDPKTGGVKKAAGRTLLHFGPPQEKFQYYVDVETGELYRQGFAKGKASGPIGAAGLRAGEWVPSRSVPQKGGAPLPKMVRPSPKTAGGDPAAGTRGHQVRRPPSRADAEDILRGRSSIRSAGGLSVGQILEVPRWRWVEVLYDVADQGRRRADVTKAGQSGGIKEGGKLKILGFKGGHALLRYSVNGEQPGTPLPSGALFFLPVEELSKFKLSRTSPAKTRGSRVSAGAAVRIKAQARSAASAASSVRGRYTSPRHYGESYSTGY